MTMPMVELTLTATGSVGTVAEWSVTEFVTRISASLILTITTDFKGYPTDPARPAGVPPSFPPAIIATNTIT